VETFDGFTSSSPLPTTVSSYSWDFGDAHTGAGPAPQHTYANAGEYDVTLTVRNSCGKEASRTERVTYDPPRAYAPAVHFHPDEEYFPGDASEFVNHSQLLWVGPDRRGCRDAHPIDSSPSANRLGIAAKDPYRHHKVKLIRKRLRRDECKPQEEMVTATDDVSVHKSDDIGMVLDAKPDYSLMGQTSGAPVYSEFSPHHWIIYWFFYPRNYWATGPNASVVELHEGDWEHITVRLNKFDHILATSFAQHECQPKATDGVTFEDGTHPNVYSAKGGHASYPTSGHHPFGCKGTYDKAGDGKVWKTWENVLDARSEPWYGFGGSWGNVGKRTKTVQVCWCVYGPPGPGPRKIDGAVPKDW